MKETNDVPKPEFNLYVNYIDIGSFTQGMYLVAPRWAVCKRYRESVTRMIT